MSNINEERRMAEIDREIEAALRVDPSAALMARVRQRLAEEPPPSRSWVMGWLASAAAVAGLAGAAAHLITPSAIEPPAATRATAKAPAPPVEEPSAPARTLRAAPPRRAVARTSVEPEVLVHPGQAALVRQLAARIRARAAGGTLLPGPVVAFQAVTVDPPALRASAPGEMTDIDVAPIDVKPLTWTR